MRQMGSHYIYLVLIVLLILAGCTPEPENSTTAAPIASTEDTSGITITIGLIMLTPIVKTTKLAN